MYERCICRLQKSRNVSITFFYFWSDRVLVDKDLLDTVIDQVFSQIELRSSKPIVILWLKWFNHLQSQKQEKWFYDLTRPRDVIYYYGINEEALKEDGTLFRKISDYVKAQADESVNVSYGVFKTSYEQKYCYCIKYSSMVQSYGELLGS